MNGKHGRVLALKNPGIERGIATTQTLAVAYQLVHAGEKAPTHRHSPDTEMTGLSGWTTAAATTNPLPIPIVP